MLVLLENDHLLILPGLLPRTLDVSDGAGTARVGNAKWPFESDDPPLPSTGCPKGPDTMLDLAEVKRSGVFGLMVVMVSALSTLLLLLSRTKVGSQPLWTSLMSEVHTVLSTLKHLTSPLGSLVRFSGAGTSGIVSSVLRVLVVTTWA